ncbi:MAG: hypothetical protein ACI9ON_003415 [Limisphaerales bacterium]|jgi:hypothetical protein
MNHYQPLPTQALQSVRNESPLSPVVRLGAIDDLETALADSWLSVTQATYRFLVLLREFEMRQGWRAYGCNDCAEWMDFKLKICRKTALEKVRVAKALWFLPKIDAVFKEGKLSYSQVRALTRVATRENEPDLVDRALTTTACNLEKYCHRLRLGDAQGSKQEARRQHENRTLHLALEDGTLTVQLPPAELAIVQQALECLVEDLPEDSNRDYFAARADALVSMARRVLDRDNSADTASPSPSLAASQHATHQVMVHVDASALNGDGGESDYPLPTVKRLCCSGEVLPILKSGDDVLNVGRNQRIVPTKLKRALAARDRQCQFPGCHHTRYLDAHHIKHWCDGGETKLDNLLLLCTHHHTLMHEGGFELKSANDKFYFARPDGRPIESAQIASSAEDKAGDGQHEI